MPAIQARQLADLATMNFKANAILLPEQFQGFTDQAPFGAACSVAMAVGMGGMLQ